MQGQYFVFLKPREGAQSHRTTLQRSLTETAPRLVRACQVGRHAQRDLDLAAQNPATPDVDLGEEGSVIARVGPLVLVEGALVVVLVLASK